MVSNIVEKEKTKMAEIKDITGKRFGKLVAIRPIDNKKKQIKNTAIYWMCKCDCGNVKIINGVALRNGNTKSCGCSRRAVSRKFKNIAGERFGKLVAIRAIKEHSPKNTAVYWECKCDCGNITVINGVALRNGNTKSCGCLKITPNKLIDITGKRFGKLVVLEKAVKNNTKNTYWVCKCDCGNVKIIKGSSLKNKNTKSCGCLRKETTHRKIHNSSKTKLFTVWMSMRHYGKKRNKVICTTWQNNFENFRNWSLNNGYTDKTFFHRKDKNGGYNPSNCYWAIKAPQKPKKDKNKIRCVETGEVFKTQREAGKKYGISPTCISYVLNGKQSKAGKYHWEWDKPEQKIHKLENITGRRFGKLIVLKKAEKDNSNGYGTCWVCRCDCGNIKIIKGYSLKNGNVKSCGCLRSEATHRKIHGDSKTKLFAIWNSMKYRAEKTNKKIYKTWQNNFNNFKNWSLKNGYTDNMFFHRKNQNGGYNPLNCYWAVKAPQKPKTGKIKIKCIETGEVFKTQRDAGKRYSINPTCISYALHGKLKSAGKYHWEWEKTK